MPQPINLTVSATNAKTPSDLIVMASANSRMTLRIVPPVDANVFFEVIGFTDADDPGLPLADTGLDINAVPNLFNATPVLAGKETRFILQLDRPQYAYRFNVWHDNADNAPRAVTIAGVI